MARGSKVRNTVRDLKRGAIGMWGLPIACYLFFGGLSAGLFIVGAIIQLAHGARFSTATCRCSSFSLIFLVAGGMLLLFDVSLPERALRFASAFQNVASSWMARGAWALCFAGTIFALYSAIASMPFKHAKALKRRRQTLLNIIGIVGILCALFLAGYTGMLLVNASGIPLWNTSVLIALFVISSLDTGVAFALFPFMGMRKPGFIEQITVRRLEIGFVALLAVEIVLLVLYLLFANQCWSTYGFATALGSFDTIVFGRFVPTIVLLLLAVGLDIVTFCQDRFAKLLRCSVSCAAIVTGLSLRIAVLSLQFHIPALFMV